MSDSTAFNELIPTAILTAYPRTFTDIPLYREIYAELERQYDGEIGDDLRVKNLAPALEARHKMLDKYLGMSECTQVLELAAGFSPRGVNFARSNPDARYVELDLPGVAELKRTILEKVVDMPDNLHVVGGNVLQRDDIERVVALFDPSLPIAIVNEGLLRYLTFDEKTQLAENVMTILTRFGGEWITGDGATKQFRDNQGKNIQGMNTTILNQTKRNAIGNAFTDERQMVDFFYELGFDVEAHPYTEVQDELSSPSKLGMTDDAVSDKLLQYASVLVLTARSYSR